MVKRKLISIGTDVGSRNGAIAIIDTNMQVLGLMKAPFYEIEVKSKKLAPKLNKKTGMYETRYRKRAWLDFKKMRSIFSTYVNSKYSIVYTVEKVGVRPGEGETQSFIFGDAFGIFKGLYAYIDPIKYYEPLPQLWKSVLGVTSDKSSSVDLANELFSIKLKKSQPDEAEALLLAYFGLVRYLEEEGQI